MNARFELRLDQAAFDRWLDNQQGKYEWKEGRVVQMVNVTRAHSVIAGRFDFALRTRLDDRLWTVHRSDFGVQRPTFTRFPDVLVEPVEDDWQGRRSQSPILLIEVLSAFSVGIDLTQKPTEYLTFPSLEACIVASQDEPICWIWQRPVRTKDAPDAARSFPRVPAEIAGRDQVIAVTSLDIVLPLEEIYRGIRGP